MVDDFDRKLRLPLIQFRFLLHVTNMRNGTYGFTSLPKEGVLRIFSPLKIRRLRPGLNPRTWVPKARSYPFSNFIAILPEIPACYNVRVHIKYCNVIDVVEDLLLFSRLNVDVQHHSDTGVASNT